MRSGDGPSDSEEGPLLDRFVAVHVVERRQYGRVKKVAAIGSAATALAFIGVVMVSSPRSERAIGADNGARARQELAVSSTAGFDENGESGFSRPTNGVFTGHSHGKNGLPLSFGKGTYYNIFDANDEFEHCDPGMFGATAADCMACPANSFCMGGKTPEKCPDNTVAPPGSHKVEQCVCKPGFFGDKPDSCTVCPANSKCPGGSVIQNCRPGTYSAEGAAECLCNPGSWGASESECESCPAGFLCAGGADKHSCPLRATSRPGATQISDCTCAPGSYEPNPNSETAGPDCVPCRANSFCPGGPKAVQCPASTFSTSESAEESDCECAPGYQGEDYKSCKRCIAGLYCPGGNGKVFACPDRSISLPGATSMSQCACAPGYVGSDPANCNKCPAGSYCPGGRSATPCPPNSVSDPGSTSCRCAPGYDGTWPSCSRCTVNGGSKCFFVPDGRRNWKDAENECARQGGHLASINSAAENDFVYGLYIGKGGRNAGGMWIGQSDNAANIPGSGEGHWKWSDGSQNVFKAWSPGEPNDWKGQAGGQDCGLMWLNDRSWDDQSCATAYPYVCAKETLPKCKDRCNCDPSTCADCAKGKAACSTCGALGGLRQSGSSKCFFVPYVGRRRTWGSAEQECVALGGHLASINSAAENNLVYSLYVSKGGRSAGAMWIGQADDSGLIAGAGEGHWRWSDASDRVYGAWSPGEPNNWGGNQDCAVMWKNDRSWDDQGCGTSYPFVCSADTLPN